MKKVFIKPEIKRIELQLNENIAYSSEEMVAAIFIVRQDAQPCYDNVQETHISALTLVGGISDSGQWASLMYCQKNYKPAVSVEEASTITEMPIPVKADLLY